MIRTVRVFLSSPGDVAAERARVRDALLGLARGPFVRGRLHIDVVSWDDPHAPAMMDGRLTPQEAVNRSLPTPAECDLTIVLLWSRLGTPLANTRPDGRPYLSGTEWEFENALVADKPVLLYRRTERVLLNPDDPQFDEQVLQRRRVTEFFDRLNGDGGAIRHAWATYDSPDQLLALVRQNVEQYLSRVLDSGESALPVPAVAVGSSGQSASVPNETVARSSLSVSGGPAEPWFDEQAQTAHFYMTEAGTSDDAATAVVFACVVVEDLRVLERQWQSAVEAMNEDPMLSALPAVASAIQRRRFAYQNADNELRARVMNVLQRLTFEAYVSFTRIWRSGAPAVYDQLVRGVVFDRLRGYRDRALEIEVRIADTARRAAVLSTIDACEKRVRELHPSAWTMSPRVLQPRTESVGTMVANYTAETMRERLERGRTARAFDLIHPTKIRVIFDADANRRYTRSEPYLG